MTSAATVAFLTRLRRLDIKLWLNGNRLRYSAPHGTLTPALKAELAEQKTEIIEFLRQLQTASADSPLIQPAPRSNQLPLSLYQQSLWFLHQLDPDNIAYNEPAAFRLHGPLNVKALEQGLAEIIRRHEILRTSFTMIGTQPAQIIHHSFDFNLMLIDLIGRADPDTEALNQIDRETLRPFDLAQSPPLRVILFQLHPEDFILFINMHHILTDGWSFGVLIEELVVLYQYFCKDSAGPYPLPELSLQYADYVFWQRQGLSDQRLETQMTYWERQLSGERQHLQFPTDHPRPAEQTFCGATYLASLPPALTKALTRLSQQQNVTLMMLMLAAFFALLHRYTGQDDLLIGSVITNRNQTALEKLIGYFVNTLVFRTNLAGNPIFNQILEQTRQMALEAYAHRDLPFEKLIERLQPERSLSHQPLFLVSFVYDNAPIAFQELPGPNGPTMGLQLPDLQIRPIKLAPRYAKFDLTLFIEKNRQELNLAWEYNSDLFETTTIVRMANHFQTLLEGIVADNGLDQRLSDLPLLTQAEQHQLLQDWNNTQADYPDDQCFHHLFEAQARQTPEAIAVIYKNEQITYRALNRRANQLAHRLRSLGVGPDVLVGIYLERSIEMVIGLLAILKAGGAYLPFDPTYPALRLSAMLVDSQPPILLTQRRFVAAVEEAIEHRIAKPGQLSQRDQSPQLLCLDTDQESFAGEPNDNPAANVWPDNLAYLIYTSGSTGRPKGVMIPHRGLVNYVSWASQAYGIEEGQGAPVHSSLSFDLTITGLLLPLMAGRTVTLLPEDEAALILSELLSERGDYSIIKITPAHLELLSQQLPSQAAAGATKSLVIGGEALSGQDLRFWQRHAPNTRLINEYGPTETVVGCCVYEVPPAITITGAVPIGRPIANTRLYLLDQQLQLVPAGVPAELYIGGEGLARGYLNRPDLTAERFVPDPFSPIPGARLYKTGDLARYRADGILEFLGRVDQQVKIRGFRIELGEIEATLSQHPAVKEVAVLARSTTTQTDHKRLIAYIVPFNQNEVSESQPLSRQLRQFLQDRLPDYMVPATLILLEALPLTPNGKIDQQALPEPDTLRPEQPVEFVSSRNQAETVLARIWAELLGLEQVGVYDNFFELGGDSILGIQVISRANQAGLRLTPRQLFQYQTIVELARVAGASPVAQAEQGPVTGPLPLTPIQHWFFEKELTNPHHWNMAVLLELPQPLALKLLEQAVNKLLLHHDGLRLRFRPTETGWRQVNIGPESDSVSVSRYDLTDIPVSEQASAIKAAASELHASLNLTTGPLIQVALFELDPQRHNRLLITIHHLLIDGVSWRILLEDLQTIYGQLSQGEPLRLRPKTTSFKQWSEHLQEALKQPFTDLLKPQLDYWLAQTHLQPPDLPVDYPETIEANIEASAQTILTSLTREETRILLQDVPAAYQTQINDILLTALTQAFAVWTGVSRLHLDLEGHGREEIVKDIDLSRTVGWFTTIFPITLNLERITDPGEALKSIKEQLRSIPNRGIDFGLLKYLGPDDARRQLRQLPQAQISFNYLGQFDQTFSDTTLFEFAPESSGLAFDPRGKRAYLLEINGEIVNGQLELVWTYSRNIHRPETIEGVASQFIESLQGLITHCQAPNAGGYTPSDFPEADLSQAELDDLLAYIDD